MSRLRICLIAPPYSGHLNPLLGIGRALLDFADVTLVSTPVAMEAASLAGIRGRAILREGERKILEIAEPGRAVKGNPLALFRQLKANVSLQADLLRELDEAFADLKPDLVIADFTLPVAGVAAGRCGARWWTTTPSPCVFETVDGPPAYFGGRCPAGTPWTRGVDWTLRMLTRGFKRLMFFLFRDDFQRVGLTSVYREDGSECCYSREAILACSVEEIEFARCYPEHFHFIGPSLFTPTTSASPEFIDGKRHLLVTLGTHLEHEKDSLAEKFAAIAASHPEWVVHFTNGRKTGDKARRKGNFQRHDFISYDEFLCRYDLVVHHGGTGILLHCLKLGLPTVVIPADFDQFDNAARLEHAGVARWAREKDRLESVVCDALADESMAQRCREYQQIVARYDARRAVRKLVIKAFPKHAAVTDLRES